MQEEYDDDYSGPGSSSKSKKLPSSSKKPVSSSSTGAKAPLSGGGVSQNAGGQVKDAKGKEPKRAKIEEPEEVPVVIEKRGARAARAGSNGKKMVDHHVEEEEEEIVEEPAVDEEEEDEGITRCVCDEDNEDLSSGLMIECDTCKCWQHGPCVGLWDEKDCPDRYYCELCRPTWHGAGGILRKAYRKGSITAAPTHRRSPSIPSAQARGNKPRESADAALVSAFLSDVKTDSKHSRDRNSQSPSPPPPPKKEEPAKKRSTMNSRDAAYDDAIAMSILGPGSAAMRARLEKSKGGGSGASGSAGSGDEEDEDGEGRSKARRSRTGDSPGREGADGSSSKRRRLSMDGGDHEEEQMDLDDEPEETLEDARREYEANEARRQAEAEAEMLAAGLELLPPLPTSQSTRAKHPNQYTYRPKGPGGPSRGRASPVKRTTKDSTSTRGDTAYNGGAGPSAGGAAFLGGTVENLIRSQRPRDWTPAESGGWGMPDHLKHLAHLLPSPMPKPLVVPAPTTYSMNAQGVEQYYEQPTKVRFPNKRMTMPEMKKRARNVLEYLGKVQVEMSERQQRARMLEAAAAAAAAGRSVAEEMAEEQTAVTASGGARGKAKAKARAEEERRKEAERPKLEESETAKAMDRLVGELHAFQQKFWGED